MAHHPAIRSAVGVLAASVPAVAQPAADQDETPVAQYGRPAVSPDGSKIAVSLVTGGQHDLYLLDIASGELEQVTSTPDTDETSPAFSPSGEQLVYSIAGKEIQGANLYLLDLGSGEARPLTNSNSYDLGAAFAPDGQQVYFARANKHRPYSMGGWTWDDWDLYRVGLDGGEPERLTSNELSRMSAPSASPDGRSVAFSTSHSISVPYPNSVSSNSLFILDGHAADFPIVLGPDHRVSLPGEKAPTRVPPFPPSDSDPAFTPDGASLLFISNREPPNAYHYEIWTVAREGGEPRQLTTLKSYLVYPQPVGNGERIVFLSDPERDKSFNVMIMNADGTGVRQLYPAGDAP